MYIFEVAGDIAWIARNLQKMEDFIFGPKPPRYFDLDNNDFDVVNNNDSTPSIIESSKVENVKLSRKKNCNKLNRNDLIKLLNFITLKLPTNIISEPLHDVNDKATNRLFISYASMSNGNGKSPTITVSSMTIYSRMSLRAFGSGFTCYSPIWRNNIENYRAKINITTLVITPNSPLIIDKDIVGTS